jgi:hypothetical protein
MDFMAEDKFKINDRVKKLGTASIHGTVVAVRKEIISSSAVNQDLPGEDPLDQRRHKKHQLQLSGNLEKQLQAPPRSGPSTADSNQQRQMFWQWWHQCPGRPQ